MVPTIPMEIEAAFDPRRLYTTGIRILNASALSRCRAIVLIAAAAAIPSAGLARQSAAQGLATAAIHGTVRSGDGSISEGGRVRVVNIATGTASNTLVRGESFFIQGLEVGGPYVVELRQLGFLPQKSEPLFLALGERRELQFVMQRAAVRLETMVSSAALTPGGGGTATLIPESLVRLLPTPNRNFYDFVRFAPQVSTKVGNQRIGVSAAGANFRFNNFLINGVDERFVNGNISASSSAGKSISLAAVKEFQVLVAPYDVRYGDFAGALVNTVTQSGSNEFRGSVFTYWRNDRMARGGDLATTAPYDRVQYGLSLGGPILRDRVHFFLAPELQRFTAPAAGPYVGQPSSRTPPVPVGSADLQRLNEIMQGYGLTAGSAELVQLKNPLRNFFGRVDIALPKWNSRAFAFINHVGSDEPRFTRAARDTFSLSSYRLSTSASVRILSLQLHTDLSRAGGGHNELVFSRLSDRLDVLPGVRQPVVRVPVPGSSGGLVTLNTGSSELGQGRSDRSYSLTVRDELSVPLGPRHVLVVGAQLDRFRVRRTGVVGAYGTWTFASLDSLARGTAERYELRKDLGSADSPLPGTQYAAYAGDEWRLKDRFSLTWGARMDLMALGNHAPFNPLVDSIFRRRTDEMPRERAHISPRLGFVWNLDDGARDKLRGGLGIFTGRPPRAWLRPALTDYGVGIGVLRCGPLPSDAGAPPRFNPDYREAPTACVTGPALTTAPLGDVSLLDRNLRMAQSLRSSLAYDRQLAGGVLATTEAVFTRYLSDFRFVNLNLQGPQRVDRFGRVLYGTIGTNGVATPVLRSKFAGVIDLTNTPRNYSYQVSTRLEKRLVNGIAASASYTFSRTRDVQSPSRVNLPGTQLWADARTVSGSHDDANLAISQNDIPHRAVVAFTYAAPWHRWSTNVSMYYVAESGSPFTYIAWGTSRRGDLNADGSNTNDPIYVPRDAGTVSEIGFSGRSDVAGTDNSIVAQAARVLEQQIAFQRFILRTPCLRNQRAQILGRNTCREPWSHTTVASIRQVVEIGGHRPEVALDIFNVLNLLNGSWGRYRVAAPRLLEHVGRTPEAEAVSQPIFRFDSARPDWTTLHGESAFNLQLGLRYVF